MEIKIFDQVYKVEEKEHIPASTTENTILGEINYVDNKITIKSSLPKDRKRKVIWHEVIHGIFNEQSFPEFRDNEILIDAIVNGIITVLDDNKGGKEWQ